MKTTLLLFTSMLLTVAACASDWTPLFDGKSLSGWTSRSGTTPGNGWKVVDGILHLDGKGGDILAEQEYSDFELEWTWKIAPRGNNGVKYWVSPVNKELLGLEYQMIDDNGHPDALVGDKRTTACLYDIKPADADKPLKPVGEWNVSRIISHKGVIEHFLNDKLVCKVDTHSEEWKSRIAASKFKKKEGFAPGRGRIMLTDHGDKTWYKEIKVRRLNTTKP